MIEFGNFSEAAYCRASLMSIGVKKRILIIEPEANMQQVVQTCLEKIGGWEVFVAASDQEGLIIAQTNQPDAILSEGMLPAINVAFLLKQLRSNPKTKEIPIVFLTADLSLTEQRRFSALGVAGAIAKPFAPLRLVPTIAAILGWSLDQTV